MTHFIRIKVKVLEYDSYISYYYNDVVNKIGDFSYYYCYSKYWCKHRRYRGEYILSKKPHKEWNSGIKNWIYNGDWYDSYEEYMLAVMG